MASVKNVQMFLKIRFVWLEENGYAILVQDLMLTEASWKTSTSKMLDKNK